MKSLAVSMILSTVAAVRRMEDVKEPFTKTPVFIIIIVAAVLLLCALLTIGCKIRNKNFVIKYKAELESMSQVADTPLGPIEYRLWENMSGKGDKDAIMLLMPGTPGVCHAEAGFSQYSGFKILTVSRPGYGRTPLTEKNKSASA
tara:strand:+ start:170 stop:604 length:435 start_codon:yes stop_codon:yes gene_type:complete